MRALLLLLFLAGCVSPMMPDVQRASPKEMQTLACGDENAHLCGDVVAVYDDDTQTMYLPTLWAANELNDYRQSILIHEFVHHVQRLRGDHETKCLGDREREAYHAQIAFLKAKGHQDPLKVLGIGPLMYAMVTRCGDY